METHITLVTILLLLCLVSFLKAFGLFYRRRMLFIDIGPTNITLKSIDGVIERNHSIDADNQFSNARLQRCIAEVVSEYLTENNVWLKPHATLCINKGPGVELTALEVRRLQSLYIGCVNSRVVDTSQFSTEQSHFMPA